MPRDDNDRIAADDLVLFIDNDGEMYRQQYTPIVKNLMTKRARGEYDPGRAIDAFMYLVESGAKKYAREHGDARTPWHVLFSVATRRAAAELLARSFETEAKLGNYDDLLPKKYQAEPAKPRLPTRAGRASSMAMPEMPAGGYDPGYIGFPPKLPRPKKKTKAQLTSEIDSFLKQPKRSRGRS
jgi:hypothetical protein